MNEWERCILEAEGLADWTVDYRSDGFCWIKDKMIQTIRGNHALFLHEVAHATADRLLHLDEGDKHGGMWGSEMTRLVNKYMQPTPINTNAKRVLLGEEER
jgi:hypothetical protein